MILQSYDKIGILRNILLLWPLCMAPLLIHSLLSLSETLGARQLTLLFLLSFSLWSLFCFFFSFSFLPYGQTHTAFAFYVACGDIFRAARKVGIRGLSLLRNVLYARWLPFSMAALAPHSFCSSFFCLFQDACLYFFIGMSFFFNQGRVHTL